MPYGKGQYTEFGVIRNIFNQSEWNKFCNLVDKKQFKKIQSLVSLFIGHFKKDYEAYLVEFNLLCQRKGFHCTTCDIREAITNHILKYGYQKSRSKQRRTKLKTTQRNKNKEIENAFQEIMAKIFTRMGYQVILTKPSHDFGADIILYYQGVKTAVQLKCRNRNIGITAIQEVVAAKRHYGCQNALVVIVSDFTDSAKKLALSNNVELWDQNKYTEMLRRYFLN
jgi:HJR/Mrr/RecB family endonuclease